MPIHAVVDGTIKVTSDPDFWLKFGSTASGIVALFTGGLAFTTRALANQTKSLAQKTSELATETVKATLTAERHHQDAQRPLLVLNASLVIQDRSERDGGYDYTFTLKGEFSNFGSGPAVSIALRINPDSQEPHEFSLGIIGPNATRSTEDASVSWKAWSRTFRENDSFWPFESVLGYSTIGFTQDAGTTKQASASGRSVDLKIVNVRPTDFKSRASEYSA